MEKIWRSALVEEMLARAAADAARPEGLAPQYGWQSGPPAAGYKLSDAQAQAILELRLQRLTGLEQEKITGEYREVMAADRRPARRARQAGAGDESGRATSSRRSATSSATSAVPRSSRRASICRSRT